MQVEFSNCTVLCSLFLFGFGFFIGFLQSAKEEERRRFFQIVISKSSLVFFLDSLIVIPFCTVSQSVSMVGEGESINVDSLNLCGGGL